MLKYDIFLKQYLKLFQENPLTNEKNISLK